MEGKPVGWLLVLLSLAVIPLALFGMVTVLNGVGGTQGHLLAWAFLVPVFAICAYTIGVIIEENRVSSQRNTSDFRREEYRVRLRGRRRR